MFDMSSFGRTLVVIGIALTCVGAAIALGVRLPWLGKLPGDIIIQKKSFTFYFPIATSILVSIALTLILFLLRRR
jgi:hypothetical protein